MHEGFILMFTGVFVVMGILIVLALAVECVIWYDNYMYRKGKARDEAAAVSQDPDRTPNEVVAAIGLAIFEFFREQNSEVIVTAIQRTRATTWSASGRLDIMANRQRITDRNKS